MKHIKTFENYNITQYELFIDQWADFIGTDEFSIDEYNQEIINISKQSDKPIYRTIMVNDNWVQNFNDMKTIQLGLFWTSDPIVAKDWNPSEIYDDRFNGTMGSIKVVIKAYVPFMAINIDATIAQNIISSEAEIRIIEDSLINVVEIKANGIHLDLSNKEFKA